MIKDRETIQECKVRRELVGCEPVLQPQHVLIQVGEALLDERLEHPAVAAVRRRRVDEARDEREQHRVDLARLFAAHHERLWRDDGNVMISNKRY